MFKKSIKNKIILFNVILFSCICTSNATNFDSTSLKYKNSFNFYVGFSYYNNSFTNNLNSLLHELKADEISNSGLGFMYGFIYEKKRFAIGLEWSSPSLGLQNKNSQSKITFSNFFIKYDVLKKKNFGLYPQIGFGVVDMQYFINTNPNNISIKQSYSNGGNTLSVINQSVILNAAIGFEHYTQSKLSPLFTYKIGFNFSPASTKWVSPSGSFNDAPSDQLSNIYFQFAFGFKSRDFRPFPFKQK